jgi:hypothetical protein
MALAMFFTATRDFAQSKPLTSGPAANGSPGWFLQASFPDLRGNTSVDANGVMTVVARRGDSPAGANTWNSN